MKSYLICSLFLTFFTRLSCQWDLWERSRITLNPLPSPIPISIDEQDESDVKDNEVTEGQRDNNPLSLCHDWIQLGVKCYKIIEKLATKFEAKQMCKQLDSSSYLVQVGSAKEQMKIFDMVKHYNQRPIKVLSKGSRRVSSIWLGAFSQDRSYFWDDKNIHLDYTNWDDESPDTAYSYNLCIQMSLETGKWSDVKCARKNLVVCEKSNELSMDNLYSALQNAYQNLLGQINQIKEVSNNVPIGFIYTQLPNQSSPLDIWPNTNWTDITDEYSGQFFRAEGKGSLPFGHIQQQSHPGLTHFEIIECLSDEIHVKEEEDFERFGFVQDIRSNWTDIISYRRNFRGVSLYKTNSDVIPVNTAIKLWKRTG